MKVGSVDFLNFLQLESNARLVLTDSGGVQGQSCILGVPCVTLRDNTERPETLEVGSKSEENFGRCENHAQQGKELAKSVWRWENWGKNRKNCKRRMKVSKI